MMSSLMKRIMVLLVSVSFFSTYSLPAWSGIVTTDQLLQQQLEVLNKSTLVAMLDRDDVRQQLVERGVDPEYAKARIAALSDAQIEAYLTATGAASTLHSLLAEDPVLRTLAESPLMLSILSLAYRGLPPESLDLGELSTMDARRKHLFDAYVDRMFERKAEEVAAYEA